LLEQYSAKEIISKIEAYENRKKEPVIEWVWHIYNYRDKCDEFYTDEIDARRHCIELAKSREGIFVGFTHVCRVRWEGI
jgi:hypothetical protein